jgi:hypothetical protein
MWEEGEFKLEDYLFVVSSWLRPQLSREFICFSSLDASTKGDSVSRLNTQSQNTKQINIIVSDDHCALDNIMIIPHRCMCVALKKKDKQCELTMSVDTNVVAFLKFLSVYKAINIVFKDELKAPDQPQNTEKNAKMSDK